MSQSFSEFWAYVLLYVATTLEGEVAYITAVIAAKVGELQIIGVAIAGLLGGFTRDMTIFSVARYGGEKFLDKRPKLKEKTRKVSRWVISRPPYLLVFHRFIYGLSTATVVSLALSRITRWQFLILNFFACLTWVVGYGILGYIAADQVMYHLDWLKEHFLYVMGGLLVLGVLLFRYTTREKTSSLPD